MHPLVSVIIPIYNGKRFLEESIQSVLSQSFQRYELLLCDDGSTDGSAEIALRYAAAYPDKIRYLQHPGHANLGQFSTRIFGARHARTGLIAPLDHDDVWDADYMERHFQIWQTLQTQGVRLSYGPCLYWFYERQDGETDYVQPMPGNGPAVYQPGDLLETFLSTNYAVTPLPSCSFIRREVFSGLGQFEAVARRSLGFEDQFLSWYVAMHWPIAAHCNAWVRYRQHSGSYLAVHGQGKRAHESELAFLGTMADYLAIHLPDHALVGKRALQSRIDILEREVGRWGELRDMVCKYLPGGAYAILRRLYHTMKRFCLNSDSVMRI